MYTFKFIVKTFKHLKKLSKCFKDDQDKNSPIVKKKLSFQKKVDGTRNK